MRAHILCLAIVLCGVARAEAQQAPRAFEGLRIGMSVEEARAVAPRVRWPREPERAASFIVVRRNVELAGGRFNFNLVFVRGVLEYMSTERGWPIVGEPDACLMSLDDIVEDIEVQLGPLDGAPEDGEATGTMISETRAPLGSHVRHYRNEQSGVLVGVAHAERDQRIEARTLIMPGGDNRWMCVYMISIAPLPPPQLNAPLVDDATPRLRNVAWLERPDGMAFMRAYPSLARQASRDGAVVMDCQVEDGGLLSCTVMSETPAGWGFGAAGMALSRQFRIAPETRDGVATAGGRVLLPIRFVAGD